MKRTILTLLTLSLLSLPAMAAAPVAADNTARNERDRSGASKTSGDQSNRPEDIKITAAIRRAVVGDGSLSMTAKNVKIITANGVVTLRGPVKTAAEKVTIAKLAKASAGKAKVENLLEVKAPK